MPVVSGGFTGSASVKLDGKARRRSQTISREFADESSKKQLLNEFDDAYNSGKKKTYSHAQLPGVPTEEDRLVQDGTNRETDILNPLG